MVRMKNVGLGIGKNMASIYSAYKDENESLRD